MNVADAHDLLNARAFDVAGVAAESIDSFVVIESLTANSGRLVGEVAQPIPASHCVEKGFPLGRLVEYLRDRKYVFVLDGDQVRWLVTHSDLEAPAVSATVLAYMAVIEQGLRQLLLHELGDSWIRHLSEARQSAIHERFDQLVRENREIGLEQCAMFSDWIQLGTTSPTARSLLGFVSGTAFKNATGFFVQLCNDVAHGRTVFDTNGFMAGVDRMISIREFADKVWSVVDGFDPNFDVYAETILTLENGDQIAGPLAIAESGWSAPVHVITAWNPGGSQWNEKLNRQANVGLLEILTRRGLHVSPVMGASPDGLWEEESFLITNSGMGYARELAEKFDQRAIFELDSDELRVIRCDDGECVRSVQRRWPASKQLEAHQT